MYKENHTLDAWFKKAFSGDGKNVKIIVRSAQMHKESKQGAVQGLAKYEFAFSLTFLKQREIIPKREQQNKTAPNRKTKKEEGSLYPKRESIETA